MNTSTPDNVTDGEPLDALVLAGSRRGETDVVARAAGVSCKVFAPVDGQPMIERVLEVLLAHPRVRRVDVALTRAEIRPGEAPRLARWIEQQRVRIVTPRPSPAATVSAVLEDRPEDASLLVATADHPLLSAAIIDRFLAGCTIPGIDVFAALLPLDVLEARYPDVRRTGLRLRDGRYSGCNLFKLRSGPGARSVASFWLRMEALRKQPMRMAWTVGPGALLAYGLHRMTLARAVDVIADRAGGRIGPVVLDIAEAAIDVDTPADLALVEAVLQRS